MQPQLTSFNPYQQQAEQEAMQVCVYAFFVRYDKQAGSPSQAEWARQQQEWMVQQQQQQQQQLQLQAQQEEWMRQQLAQQQMAQQQALLAQQQQEYLAAQAQQQARLVPQPTAFGFGSFLTFCLSGALTTLCDSSNNPFAVTASSAPPVPSPQPPQQASLSNFSLPSTYESHEPSPRQDFATPSQPAPAPSPQSAVKRSETRTDQDHTHLASLFAARDGEGVDTFGNVGTLRYATHFLFSCLVLF
jgi:epsin